MPFSSSSLTSEASVKRGGGCVKCCSGSISVQLQRLALGELAAAMPSSPSSCRPRRVSSAALAVHRGVAGELQHLAGGAQAVARPRVDVDGGLVVDRRLHLAGDEAVPDELVEPHVILDVAQLLLVAVRGGGQQPPHRLGSYSIEVGRIASCASCALFLVL